MSLLDVNDINKELEDIFIDEEIIKLFFDKYCLNKLHSVNDWPPIQFKHVLEFLNNYRADKCSKHYNFHYKKYMA